MSMDARVDALRWRELPESWCSTADVDVCALRSVGADASGYGSQMGLKFAEGQLMKAIFLIAI